MTNDDLVEFCRDRLASFKVPRYTLAMEEFPMTPSGKVQKNLLRDMALKPCASPRLRATRRGEPSEAFHRMMERQADVLKIRWATSLEAKVE